MALYFILKSFIVFIHSKIAFIDDYLLVSKAAGIIRQLEGQLTLHLSLPCASMKWPCPVGLLSVEAL